MSSVNLTQTIVNKSSCPEGKSKIRLFDCKLLGLSIEVRPSGNKSYHFSYKDYEGRQRQVCIGNASSISLSVARKAALKIAGEIALGKDPRAGNFLTSPSPTLAEFFYDQYLQFIKGYKRSWFTDVSIFRNRIAPLLGARYMNQITNRELVALQHNYVAGGGAPAYANRMIVMVRYFYNLALRWGVSGIHENPVAKVSLLEVNNLKERYLSTLESFRLYSVLKNSQFLMLKFIVPMLILTGARKREVLDACWEDFDFERQQWLIPMSKSGKRRFVPLSTQAIALLEQVPRFDSCIYVFPNPETLKPYSDIFYSWNIIRRKAGLKDLRVHDLRHSFASFLVNAGRQIYEVQKILGHSQIRTTQRYAHLANETLIDASNDAAKMTGLSFLSKE